MRKIDHIAYAVPKLNEGISYLKKVLGCEINMGGRHLTKGTHNALVNLGNDIYLEIISTDPNNQEIAAPRWMGVDLIEQPMATRWALKTNDLNSDLQALKKYNAALAVSFEGSRKKQDGSMLNWQMALPLPDPAVEIAPFFVDWKDSAHPTYSLEQACELLAIKFYHPNPTELQQLFKNLNLEYDVMKSESAKIELDIKGPSGVISI